MDLKVIDKKKNEIMKRTEVTAEVEEELIPSRQQVKDKLAAMLSVKADAIAINKIESKLKALPRSKIGGLFYFWEMRKIT